jgi:hypothetical protein
MTTTYERAGVDRADVAEHLNQLNARFNAAAKGMTATWFRHDDMVPQDMSAPELPALPVLPPEYLGVVDLTSWEAGRWSPESKDPTAIHRDTLPRGLLRSAAPAAVVAALRAIELYVADIEQMARDYHARVEQAVAAHIAEQDGNVHTLAEIVAAHRAARESAAADKTRQAAEAAEAKAAALADRAAWIKQHGSSRLKRLVAAAIEHDAVYRDERIAHDRPEWIWSARAGIGALESPRNAPEAALDLLDAARATEPKSQLKYYRICREASDDDEDDGDEIVEAGYVAEATFLDRDIVTRARVRI